MIFCLLSDIEPPTLLNKCMDVSLFTILTFVISTVLDSLECNFNDTMCGFSAVTSSVFFKSIMMTKEDVMTSFDENMGSGKRLDLRILYKVWSKTPL